MAEKRGQPQLGIAIVAVVIFIGLVGILYQVDKSVRELRAARTAIDDQALSSHMQRCLEQALEEAAVRVAAHGGYREVPQPNAQLNTDTIPIYLDMASGAQQIPANEAAGNMIAAAVQQGMPQCLDLFAAREYEIEKGEPIAKVEIVPGALSADLEYPLTLQYGKNRKELLRWHAELPLDLHAAFAAARTYAQAQQEKSFIRFQALVDAVGSDHVEATLTDLGNGMVAYQFKTGNVALQFAIAYRWAALDTSFAAVAALLPEQINALDIPVKVAQGTLLFGDFENLLSVQQRQANHPPTIPNYGTQKVVVGRTLLFPLNAEDPDGDPLTYEILTPLPGLLIRPGGILQWGPTNYQEVTIKFRVSDSTASTDGELHLIVDYRPRVDFNKLSYGAEDTGMPGHEEPMIGR